MTQTSWTLTATSVAMTVFTISTAQAASDPIGVWTNDTGRGAIEIKSCGAALCGFVVAVKDETDTKGCGKQIIGDAQSAGGGSWDNGWIYSPEKKKNYDVELTPLKDGTLRVVGYAGTKLFSRTMIWTRGAGNLKACGTAEAKASPAPSSTAKPVEPPAKPEQTPPPVTAAATPPPAPPAATPAPPEKPTAAPAVPSETAKPARPPAATADTSEAGNANTKTAEGDAGDETGEKPGERKKSRGGGLKLGDLNLDSVLTRTKSGRCKLDLPWVKVQFECERE